MSILARGRSKLLPAATRRRTFESRLAALHADVDAICAGDGPIVAGPWRGDLGYELLFWIPLLRTLTRARPELRRRLMVLSRGGVSSWYADIADQYTDIFELMTYDEMTEFVKSEPTAKRHGVLGKKQRSLSDLDRDLVRRVAERNGTPEPRVLEPRLAIDAMQLADIDLETALGACLTFAPIVPPLLDDGVLPPEFVAMRFYANPQLPAREPNRSMIRNLVGQVSSTRTVVLIETGLKLGGHSEFDGLRVGTVVPTAHLMEPARNLAMQTAILGRAGRFVGTYGGLSYLATAVGVPAVGLYSNAAKINPLYLRVAVAAAGILGHGYAALDVSTLAAPELEERVAVALS